ncbi:Hephaestin [Gracilaria domingensis]|nr:Hephaestin [Gracilaria domingensis]
MAVPLPRQRPPARRHGGAALRAARRRRAPQDRAVRAEQTARVLRAGGRRRVGLRAARAQPLRPQAVRRRRAHLCGPRLRDPAGCQRHRVGHRLKVPKVALRAVHRPHLLGARGARRRPRAPRAHGPRAARARWRADCDSFPQSRVGRGVHAPARRAVRQGQRGRAVQRRHVARPEARRPRRAGWQLYLPLAGAGARGAGPRGAAAHQAVDLSQPSQRDLGYVCWAVWRHCRGGERRRV